MKNTAPELNQALLKPGSHVLAGCSGGADSLCMTELLCRLRTEVPFTLTVIHVHHGLRENADADAAFVRAFCETRGIPFVLRRIDVRERVNETGESVEEAARILRYRAIFDTAVSVGADTAAVAHHMEDQAETVLFQMIRGSGLSGLSGIPEERTDRSGVRLIRPLLHASRGQIERFLETEGITWREDETNAADDAARNRIRHHILPALDDVRPGAVRKIVKTASYLGECDAYFKEKAEEWFRAYARQEKNGLLLPAEAFAKEHPLIGEYIVAGALRTAGCRMKDKGRVHLDAVAKLFPGAVGREILLPDDGYAVRTYEGVLIRKEKETAENDAPACEGTAVSFEKRTFPYEKGMIFPDKAYTKCFDCDKIMIEPVLRTRLPGDRFSTASGTHKKLKDYLIDEKIPQEERDSCLLLASGQDILWVVGYRMSEAYKVTENTLTVLEVTVKAPEEGEEQDEGRQDQGMDFGRGD